MKSVGFEVTIHVTNIGAQGYPGTGKTSTLNLITGEKSVGIRNSTRFVESASRRMYIQKVKDSTVWEKVTTDRMSELVCEAMKEKIVLQNQQKEAQKKDAQQNKSQQKDAQQKKSQKKDAQQKKSQKKDEQQKESQQEDAQQNESHQEDALEKEAQRGVQQKDAQQEDAQNKDPQPLNNKQPSLEDEDTSSKSSLSWPHTEPAATTSSSPQHSQKDLDPYSAFPDLLRQVNSTKGSGVIFESHWMVVTDCGGQPPFLDAAALFHRNRCLHIFPVKLNERLKETPKFTYFLNGKDACLTNILVPQTNLQVIETLAKSAAAVQPTSTQSKSDSQQGTACTSKFIVVGTFSDKMDDCNETVQEKEKKLKRALSPYKRIHMFDQGNAIVQIDATTKDEKKRKEFVTKLKKLIEDSGTALKYKVKLRFFVLLLSMNKMAEMEEKAVLHIDECIELGEKLAMDKSETIEAIHFFHNIGQIMYFDTSHGMSRDTSCKLGDFVIVKDEPVLERVSKLLSVPFIRRDSFNGNFCEHKRLFSRKAPSLSPEDSTLSEKTQTKFQQYGEFDPKDLQFLQLTEKELEFFLAMLEYVKAIAKTTSGNYFMPCALPYTPTSKQEILDRFSEYVWIIKFERVLGETPEFIPVPVGYLPALLVILLTHFYKFFATSGKHQYRDCITLVYKDIWNICIVERHLQLEVYFTGCEFTSECSDIRKFVLEAMMETDMRLRIDQLSINKIDCFLCSCGEGSSRHLCTYYTGLNVECEEHPESHLELNDNQRIWIQSGKQTDESKQDNNSTDPTKRSAPEPIKASQYLGYWWMWLLPVVIALLYIVYQSCKLYSMKPSVVPDSLVVYGETVLTVVGDKQQELRWPDYGFYLDIPEGALPPDVTASVAVRVISGEQFELPENSRFISAVYWISSSEIFLKEVAVNMQHCAVITSEEQLSKFKFVIAKRFQEVLLYDYKENGGLVLPNRFKEREGFFSAHTRYGTIKLNQFSLIAVTAPPDTEPLYTGLMYYKQSFPDPLTVDFRFVVVKDLEAYLQGVNMNYQEWSLDDHTLDIRFEDEAVMINQQEEEVDSWKIYPLSPPPQVAKDAVSNFQVGRRIPHCAFELQLLDGKSRRLLHKVDLTGVASPDFFYIRYPQPESNKVKTYIQPTPLAGSLTAQESVVSQQNQELENVAIHTLEELLKELPTINYPVDFGIHLGVGYDDCQQKVQENAGNVKAQAQSIVSAWYKGSRDPPTWNKVVKALLEHKLVRDAELLAKRKGVKLPQSQHGDSDHHEL